MNYKKLLTVLFVAILLPVVGWGASTDPRSLGWEGTPGQPGTNSNPHNLSRQSSNAIKAANTGDPYETQICVFCHTPHGATPQTTLWNRPDPDRMGSFPTFDPARANDTSGNFGIDDAGIVGTSQYGVGEYPNGATKLCLSCHDGVTAIGTLANGLTIAMNATNLKAGGSSMFWDPVLNDGMDFSRTHPVSFVYNQTVADYLNTVKNELYVSPPPAALLDTQSRLQCTSCHDPHLDTNDGGSYRLPFWRNHTTGNEGLDYDNTCAACHIDNPGFLGTGSQMHNI